MIKISHFLNCFAALFELKEFLELFWKWFVGAGRPPPDQPIEMDLLGRVGARPAPTNHFLCYSENFINANKIVKQMIKLWNFYHRHIVTCVTYEKYQNHISVYILNKSVETTMYQNLIQLKVNVFNNCITINILQSLLHINRTHIYNWFRIHECTIYLSGNNSRFSIFACTCLLIFSDTCFYNFHL